MRCFDHPERPAVGICKSCQKGLCPECAVDFDAGLACRGRCETDVRAVIRLIRANVSTGGLGSRLVLGYRRNLLVTALYFLILGTVFVVTALRSEGPVAFVLALGVILLIYGAFQFLRGLRLRPGP